jgi:hypothetical protein
MNPETDRVPVPTNGRGPHSPEETGSPAKTAARPTAPAGSPPAADPATPAGSDPRIVVSPTQLAVGFGIIASLVLVLVGRRRRGGGGAGGEA